MSTYCRSLPWFKLGGKTKIASRHGVRFLSSLFRCSGCFDDKSDFIFLICILSKTCLFVFEHGMAPFLLQ